jgi:hypothetical protein
MPITLDDLKIIPLTTERDVSGFDCGDLDLNEFVQVDCRSYQEQYMSHTRIAFHREQIVGYITPFLIASFLKPKKRKSYLASIKRSISFLLSKSPVWEYR